MVNQCDLFLGKGCTESMHILLGQVAICKSQNQYLYAMQMLTCSIVFVMLPNTCKVPFSKHLLHMLEMQVALAGAP